MESLQLAQMLADLSDLSAAQEAKAALAVVEANKTLPPAPTSDTSAHATASSSMPTDQAHPTPRQRVGSTSDVMSRTVSPTTLDKFGRRILTPPLSRTNSNQGTPGTSTPVRGFESEDDIARATSLMQLYDIRAKLKQQDNSAALAKARERISALHARQQQIHSPSLGAGHATPDVPQSRFTYPKSSA